MNVTLFTGPECHLCQLAIDEIEAFAQPSLNVTKLNIREDASLYHLYAMRIPVLKRDDTAQELNWPFSRNDIEHFIQ